jgi:hypothetical protein
MGTIRALPFVDLFLCSYLAEFMPKKISTLCMMSLKITLKIAHLIADFSSLMLLLE